LFIVYCLLFIVYLCSPTFCLFVLLSVLIISYSPPRNARIALSYPSLAPQSPSLAGRHWVIDGSIIQSTPARTPVPGIPDGRADLSPYTLLIGVALTDMTEPYTGAHCVYPSSHIFLQETLKQQSEAGTFDLMSPFAAPSKPALSEPVQVSCLHLTGTNCILIQPLVETESGRRFPLHSETGLHLCSKPKRLCDRHCE
jgi:hypothetical protein